MNVTDTEAPANKRSMVLRYALWLIFAPFALAAAQGASPTSVASLNAFFTNVVPVTTLIALAWYVVNTLVLGPGNFRWWRIALGVLMWLVATPFIYAFGMGGVLLAAIHVFRVLPYAGGLAFGALALWVVLGKLATGRNYLRPAARHAAALFLVLFPFFSQMMVFPLASGFANRWQMAYCEWQVIPRIEAYRDANGRLPGSLSQVMPAYLPIPPDVVYYEGSLRIEDRGDVLDDYIYRGPGRWEHTD